MEKSPDVINFILTTMILFCGVPLSYGQQGFPDAINGEIAKKIDINSVEASLDYNGKIYRVERLLLKAGKYGPLTLSVYERDSLDYNRVNSRNIVAPSSEGLEISEIEVIQLKGRPFFFVKGRYELFLIDLQGEKIAPFIRPGLGVEYGEDAISGTMKGFQFFDEDDYLLGIAVSYGVFCFNISDLDHPKELLRYSSDFSDHGQPYFFLEKNVDGFYNGIMSQSDTAKKSSHVSGFYTATKQARYLFRDVHLMVPEASYADPADYEIGHPEAFLLLYEKGENGKKIPWVIDLKKGIVIKDEAAKRFLDKI